MFILSAHDSYQVMNDMPIPLCALDDMPYSHGRSALFSWTICHYFPILMQFSLLECIEIETCNVYRVMRDERNIISKDRVHRVKFA